jgi:hypothetical protein
MSIRGSGKPMQPSLDSAILSEECGVGSALEEGI